MEKTFKHSEVEARLIKHWEETNAFNAGVHTNQSANSTFSIVIPPPNVTGNLHMGHAFNNTIQDILIRWHRMRGFDTLWQPGQDHAGIATQMVVERELEKKENISREDLGRKKFLEKIWEWKNQSGGMIIEQLKRLGASCDWNRNRFTMDNDFQNSVINAFVKMYEMGYIYKGERLVNWDVVLQTALSDLEVTSKEATGSLWYFDYPVENGSSITVATTRPETMLGDTAVAVNPNDERFKGLIGKFVKLPITNRKIPIIKDSYVDEEFSVAAFFSFDITGESDYSNFSLSLLWIVC